MVVLSLFVVVVKRERESERELPFAAEEADINQNGRVDYKEFILMITVLFLMTDMHVEGRGWRDFPWTFWNFHPRLSHLVCFISLRHHH